MVTDRFDRGAVPFLLGHNWNDQVGVVVSAFVSEGRGYATVKVSQSARGGEIFRDIKDGIRTNISVGYIVRDMKPVSENERDRDVSDFALGAARGVACVRPGGSERRCRSPCRAVSQRGAEI